MTNIFLAIITGIMIVQFSGCVIFLENFGKNNNTNNIEKITKEDFERWEKCRKKYVPDLDKADMCYRNK